MEKHSPRVPLLLLLLLAMFLQSCNKEEDMHPEVQTLEITQLNSSSVKLEGRVVRKGSFPVEDYGFEYSISQDLSQSMGTKVSLGKEHPGGVFHKELHDVHKFQSIGGSRFVNARAYLTNTQGTIYGQIQKITLPEPTIQGITPASGKAGDRVTIRGKFAIHNNDEVKVTFNGTQAKVLEASETQIVAEIPTGIPELLNTTKASVSLHFSGLGLGVTTAFQIIPTITQVAPAQAYIGSTVTISGQNFPIYQFPRNIIRVFFDDIESTVNAYSPNGVEAVVPVGYTRDKVKIAVIFDGVRSEMAEEFTVLPPVIHSISPTSGMYGANFTVYGEHLANPTQYAIYGVRVGGHNCSIQGRSGGHINVMLPLNVPVGKHDVVLYSGAHEVIAAQQFEVLPLQITGFYPTSGIVGQEVTLQGRFKSYTHHTVTFGSVSTEVYHSHPDGLKVKVPAGQLSDKVKISVTLYDFEAMANQEFTILTPALGSFAPTAGATGTVVTINCSNFSPTTATKVRFGTIDAGIAGFTANTISAIVPASVAPGAMKISVIHSGHTLTSSSNFTVTN